jgi:hypothetical protein
VHAGIHNLIEEYTHMGCKWDSVPGLDIIAAYFTEVIEVS